MDVLTPQQRSFNMSRIRGKDTSPEKYVRTLIRSMGYRYRLHVASMPGKPDVVISKHKAIIFIHGCFWHMHSCKYGRVVPRTNQAFWKAKREGNKHRDRINVKKLRRMGWKVLIIWECWIRRPDYLLDKLKTFINTP